MLYFENKYKDTYTNICGVDEAGAGPLAGPVVAAAVVMPIGFVIQGVTDSKKLSEKKRVLFYDEIIKNALCHNIVFVENSEIDEINILQARLKAMRLAVEGLSSPAANFALVDGNYGLQMDIPNVAIEKGDAVSHSIACASILAKVTRDAAMVEYSKIYPNYGFEKHKGYGTKAHKEALAAHGLCPIHRRSFIKGVQ